MGMYCACGVKKRNDWVCQCDWKGWYLCFRPINNEGKFPDEVPIKEIPNKNGTYLVRVFEDNDNYEEESEFSITKKNWGEYTNKAITHWKIEYQDNWCGFRGVYAWKEKNETNLE